jgi:hypothetical protein
VRSDGLEDVLHRGIARGVEDSRRRPVLVGASVSEDEAGGGEQCGEEREVGVDRCEQLCQRGFG